MLKKSLYIQIILLLIVSSLGFVLTTNTTDSVRMLHAGLGFLTGLNALAAAYFAITTKQTQKIIGFTLAIVLFTALAGIGGKITDMDYNFGLLLMRASAIVALIATGIATGLVSTKKGK